MSEILDLRDGLGATSDAEYRAMLANTLESVLRESGGAQLLQRYPSGEFKLESINVAGARYEIGFIPEQVDAHGTLHKFCVFDVSVMGTSRPIETPYDTAGSPLTSM